MLLDLFQYLGRDLRVFNVFNYITLRTVLATMTAQHLFELRIRRMTLISPIGSP